MLSGLMWGFDSYINVMKLTISKSKNTASLYVTKSFYVNGKHTSKVVEKLGTFDELRR